MLPTIFRLSPSSTTIKFVISVVKKNALNKNTNELKKIMTVKQLK